MKDRFQIRYEKDVAALESLLKREGAAILEWKTRSPFPGCFWRWSYAYVSEGLVAPVVTTEQDIVICNTTVAAIISVLGEPAGCKFDTFSVYDVDEDLWKDIPDGFIPDFWKFFHWERGDRPVIHHTFSWNCDGCGLTTNEPKGMSGCTGNGGVGIEPSGWYCDECHGSIQCSSCGVLNDPQQPWWDHDPILVKLYADGHCPCCKEEQ